MDTIICTPPLPMPSVQSHIPSSSLGRIDHPPGVFPYSESPDSSRYNEKIPQLRGNFADTIGKILVQKNKSIVLSDIDITDAPIRFGIEGQDLYIRDITLGASESDIRRELSRVLGGSGLRIIRFDPCLDTEKKRILANMLAKNHPLIEVLRLIPGNDVVNVSFAGIKKLNDIYGQSFVDRLLLFSKERIIQSLKT